MKLLFLDVDGVIVTHKSLRERKQRLMVAGPEASVFAGRWTQFDPSCMIQLERLVFETGVEVVLSSSWRTGNPSDFNDDLRAWGSSFRIMGETPNDPDRFRSKEIDAWLMGHVPFSHKREEILVLDDDTYDLKSYADRQVVTSMEHGLTVELADKAIAMMNGGK